MSIRGVHHIAVICSDYPASKRFYTEVIGCRVIREIYRAERRSYKCDLLIPGRERLEDASEGVCIELFSFPDAPPRPSYPEARGLRHLAFRVDDLDAEVERLIVIGVRVEPVRIDEATQARFTFFADPDGLPIELYEIR